MYVSGLCEETGALEETHADTTKKMVTWFDLNWFDASTLLSMLETQTKDYKLHLNPHDDLLDVKYWPKVTVERV